MPKLNATDHIIEAALLVCEYGFEYLTYENVGKKAGLTGPAIRYHFMTIGGKAAMRAAVIELARRRRNPYILGQLSSMRPASADALRS